MLPVSALPTFSFFTNLWARAPTVGIQPTSGGSRGIFSEVVVLRNRCVSRARQQVSCLDGDQAVNWKFLNVLFGAQLVDAGSSFSEQKRKAFEFVSSSLERSLLAVIELIKRYVRRQSLK